MGPSSLSCKLNPWCHFFFGWRHVVGLWLRCMTWRLLISLNSISLYSALLLYISYIYTVYCILAVCGVQYSMTFLAGICKWSDDWLVDYNWKWPLTLCAIVSCSLVMFYISCWVCGWMYCIFYLSTSLRAHQQYCSLTSYYFYFLVQILWIGVLWKDVYIILQVVDSSSIGLSLEKLNFCRCKMTINMYKKYISHKWPHIKVIIDFF